MTLRRKMEKDFISKGADVMADKKASERVDICLRMSCSMLNEMDSCRVDGTSRNSWIREAIAERIKRLKMEDKNA